jgi:hypothetical protein
MDVHISVQTIENLWVAGFPSPNQLVRKDPALDFQDRLFSSLTSYIRKLGVALPLIFHVGEQLSANLPATKVIMKGLAVRLFDVERSNCPKQ